MKRLQAFTRIGSVGIFSVVFSGHVMAAVVSVTCSTDGGTNCPSGPDSIINTGPPVVSDLEVAAGTCPGIVTDVDVTIDIQHSWVGDLEVSLKHDGLSVLFLENQCSGDDDILATFDDEAAAGIDCSLPPPVGQGGVVLPSNPLSGIDGTNAEGIWSLEIIDEFSPDSGQLLDWGLTVTCEPPPPPSQIGIDGGYMRLDITNGAVPINADCETLDHEGRMIFDNVNHVLYICTSTGWQSK